MSAVLLLSDVLRIGQGDLSDSRVKEILQATLASINPGEQETDKEQIKDLGFIVGCGYGSAGLRFQPFRSTTVEALWFSCGVFEGLRPVEVEYEEDTEQSVMTFHYECEEDDPGDLPAFIGPLAVTSERSETANDLIRFSLLTVALGCALLVLS